jgi:hypothetical protein
MKRYLSILAVLLLSDLLFITACTIQTEIPLATISPESSLAISTAINTPSQTPQPQPNLTETLTPPPDNLANYIFPPFGMNGTLAWKMVDGQPVKITLPDFALNAYDRSPQTGYILHPSKFPDHGAGPSNLSVGDLYIYDLETQADEPIFVDETIVEAVWAPNGEDFVYLLATEDTYELRYRMKDGDDRLLAVDVAPVFNISPDSKLVAFTRESGYRLGQPGVYVVSIDGGNERKVSDIDREGMGSIADIPLWSADSRFILLSVSQVYNPLRWFLIAADGSLSQQLTFAPSVPQRYRQQEFNAAFWMPDGSGFIGVQNQGMTDPPYTQEVAVAKMDLTNGQVSSLTPVDWGGIFPITWETPGSRLWEMTEDGTLVLLDLSKTRPFPTSCKQPNLYTFANPYKGYCFAYPQDVTLQAYEYERPLFLGKALDDSLEPLQARLWVETEPLEGGNLQSAIDEFITSQPQGFPEMVHNPILLGGEPAELIENVPGQLLSKVVISVKNDLIYKLWFNPVDPTVPDVQPDVQRLYEAVIGSWGWLEIR